MLNDWKWKKIDNYEYVIQDDNNALIIDLIQTWNKQWMCTFYNNEYKLKYQALFPENMTIKEIQWKVIIWVYNQCNKIAYSFHHIRDHLPSARDIFDKI